MAARFVTRNLRKEKTITTERPKITQEMIEQAAKKLAERNGWDDEKDLSKAYRPHMDGYELEVYGEELHEDGQSTRKI